MRGLVLLALLLTWLILAGYVVGSCAHIAPLPGAWATPGT